jgi:hypothetical protein
MTKAEIEYYTRGLNFVGQNKIFVYKYIDLQGGLELINNQTFKFSHPKDFNDPFDLYEELVDFTKHDSLDNLANQNRIERRRLKSIPLKAKVEALKYEWRKQRMNYGISCFSKTFKEILMWSHYSDKHQGVCIGFLIDAMKFLQNGFYAFAVEYNKEFVSLPYSDNSMENGLETIMQYLSLKADFWTYEQEIRLVNVDYFSKYKNEFFKFTDFAEIKEVYFGIKTNKRNKDLIKTALSKQKIKPEYFDLIPVKNKFELEKINASF